MGGVEHQDKKIVNEGYWMLGWEKKDQSAQYALAKQMMPGERIAIKRIKGQGKFYTNIFDIEIIKGVILETNKVICTVYWGATYLERDIEECRGGFKYIHDPY